MTGILYRECEGRRWVTNGSRTCPHPRLADQNVGETYEEYVKRHCLDHELGEFEKLEDAEANLGTWCLFFLDKHIVGNDSLGTKTSAGENTIVADYEPCWEDCEYLANWTFHPDDLEQNTEWKERTFRLAPAADRRPGVYKRFKKETKVRGTQKTSRAKALLTQEHLHEYFIKGNIFFRALTISAVSTLAREHYYKPLKGLWRSNRNIKRLYGAWEVTKAGQRTRIGLVSRGSFGRDVITMRWAISNEDSSGMSTVSVMCAGVDTGLTGSRWDIVFFDDPHGRKNVQTHEQRQKVKDTHAELRKQLDAAGRMLWLNTPWHVDDASAEIDEKFGDEWHILERPGRWISTATHQFAYYWSNDALGRVVWDENRITKESKQSDFASQVLLRPRDQANALFEEKDFPIVDEDKAPPEVRFGRGRDLTDDERTILAADQVEIRSYLFCDPSGNDEQKTYGYDSAVVGIRPDRWGTLWVTHINSGQWNASQEHEAIFQGWLHTRAQIVEYEISGGHGKHVKRSFLDFQGRKSVEMRCTISMPIVWEPATKGQSSDARIERMQPFAKTGRIKILSDAGSPEQIAKFRKQFADWGVTTGDFRDDVADAASRILGHIEAPSFEEAEAATAAVDRPEFTEENGGTFNVPLSHLIDKINAMEGVRPDAASWGTSGVPHDPSGSGGVFDRLGVGQVI